MKKLFILLLAAFLFFPYWTHAQKLIHRVVAEHLDTPWEILWGPDNNIWMTERRGVISRVNAQNGNITTLLKLNEIIELTESGLMGMALDPDFNNNHYLYVAYTYQFAGAIIVRVSRFSYANDTLTSEKILIDEIRGSTNHDGCRLAFGPDGKLYVSTGDATDTSLPQDTTKLNGKILRLNADGSIPSDNPIAGSYIWAYGLRNTQGLVWVNGKLYGSEHGVDTDDEVNLLQAHRNYGWPEVNGYCDQANEKTFCDEHNVMEPLHTWTPTIAPGGIDYYEDGPITSWKNSLLMTSLKGEKLVQLVLNENGDAVTSATDFFRNQYGRLRDLCISPDGKVYIATSNQDGRGDTVAPTDDRIIEISAEASSIKSMPEKASIRIYPNPSSEVVNIEGLPVEAKVEIRNMLGQTVALSTQAHIDCGTWPAGAYLFYVHSREGVYVMKVLVAH